MDKKVWELLDVSIDMTECGRLEWTAFDSESFRAKVGPGYLHIQRSITEIDDGERVSPRATYSIQVSDAQGRVVAEEETVQGFDGFPHADRLFQAARKAALATDRVIDDMLRSLRNAGRAG